MSESVFVNMLIAVLLMLCSVVMGIILYEIRKVRERLHKVEGGQHTIASTLTFFREFMQEFKDVHTRLAVLESRR